MLIVHRNVSDGYGECCPLIWYGIKHVQLWMLDSETIVCEKEQNKLILLFDVTVLCILNVGYSILLSFFLTIHHHNKLLRLAARMHNYFVINP